MTVPARSVFAEPLARARAYAPHFQEGPGPLTPTAESPHTKDCPGCVIDAALDLIEQRAADMETALRRIADIPPGADDDSIYARGVALAALSAREEAQ